MSLMSSSYTGAKDLLSHWTTALTWTGMSCRAHKSCSIVITKERSMNLIRFSKKNESAPTEFSTIHLTSYHLIHSQPVKFLGRIVDGSLNNRKIISGLRNKPAFTFENYRKVLKSFGYFNIVYYLDCRENWNEFYKWKI